MWINYIGEIAAGVCVLLVLLHLGPALVGKLVRIQKEKRKLKQTPQD
ncbi:MAG: hypothetical protein ISEC1_P0747 [Thiomicrorhabdus sp.]|nr:MAG: hypothetical protein ISEC1_P0747 [Thiomicrorhabdus sp.]